MFLACSAFIFKHIFKSYNIYMLIKLANLSHYVFTDISYCFQTMNCAQKFKGFTFRKLPVLGIKLWKVLSIIIIPIKN